MIQHHSFLVLLLFSATTAACGGLSFGESSPGGNAGESTYLAGGAIAVDPRNENIFVLTSPNTADDTPKGLLVVDPDSAEATPLLDLTGYSNIRIVFPKDRVLVMGTRNQKQTFFLFDPNSLEMVLEETLDPVAFESQVSPTGEWLLGRGPFGSGPSVVIDMTTLEVHPIVHDGDQILTTWQNKTDQLIAAISYEDDGENRLRVFAWDMDKRAEQDWAVVDGTWSEPAVDVVVDDAGLLPFGSTITIAPDDSAAVFTASTPSADQNPTEGNRLVVIDLSEGTARNVPHAEGPAGFTPDSSTIVAHWLRAEDEHQNRYFDLVLIDADTLAPTNIALPKNLEPRFFVSHEGNQIVVSKTFGGEGLLLIDAETQKVITIQGAIDTLANYVTRPDRNELWAIDRGLHRIDLMTGLSERISAAGTPDHINILPSRDELVLNKGVYDEEQEESLSIFSMGDKKVRATLSY
ncbi:MAG: hypothetical protein KC416_11275 [Myxococcales bacterium]|nr:hypothetical protein [Myxococcales bacterium]